MKLVSKFTSQKIREAAAANPAAQEIATHYAEYGSLTRVQGTGRATCRCCGKRIHKGEPSLKWAEDMHGNGSYTATEIQIHERICS